MLEALAAASPGVGVPARPGPAERPARVHLAPPPAGADALTGSIAAGVPFVTWPGAASELELGDLTPRVVAGDPADLGRLASALHGDRGLWEEVRRDLLGISRGRAAVHGRGLWRGLAHCGTAPAPVRPPAERARAQLGESQRTDGLQERRGRNGQGP